MLGDSKQVLILFAVVAVASGCAGGGGGGGDTPSNTVVSVETFEAIPNPADSARTVNFNMELENTGDSDATNVAARLFGPTFAGPDGSGPRTWKDSSSGEVSVPERTMNFGTLRAAADNTPAIPKAKSVSLTSPSLGQNREVEYNFYSQIFYEYETQASTDFKIVSYDRFQDEDMSRTSATLDAGSGPIQLDIRGTTPKIFYGDDNTEGVQSEICIRVINEGSGTPVLQGAFESEEGEREYQISEDEKNKVQLSIQNIGNVNFNARGEQSGNTVDVKLVSGTEGYQCFQMAADVPPNTQEQTVNTQITASYGYVKEDETPITVEGRRGLEPQNE